MEHDFEKVVNMELSLCIFEQLSGFKINFYKSEIFSLVKQNKMRMLILEFLAVERAHYRSNIWVSQIYYRRLLNKEWKLVKDCLERKLIWLLDRQDAIIWSSPCPN
jgi:hypothetical protein